MNLNSPDSDGSGQRPDSRSASPEPESQPGGRSNHNRGRKRRRSPSSVETQIATDLSAAESWPELPDIPTPSDPLVIELEAQLREKEEIIAALTERLEQAAEQLDRLRRTGGDRGGGLPAETVAEHASLMEELREAVQQWQDMQAAAAFGRIECQIGELRDLVSGHLLESPARHDDTTDRHQPQVPAPSLPATGPSATSPRPGSWEAQKAALLGDPLPIEPATEPQAEEPVANCAPLSLPEPPAPLHLQTASMLELQAALSERDVYIELLREHLQLACAAPDSTPDIPNLDELPDAQRAAIRAWENRIQSRLRKSEIEVSLERARLSRDEIALRQQQEQFVKEQRRLGLRKELKVDEDQLDDKTTDDAPHGKRWLGFLGSRAPKNPVGEKP